MLLQLLIPFIFKMNTTEIVDNIFKENILGVE